MAHRTSRRRRLLVAIACGALGGGLAWRGFHTGAISDFTHLWFAARAMLGGQDPYAVIGPGRAFEWPLPLLYPLPAVLAAMPFAPFAAHAADIAFAGISALLFAYALTRNGYARLPAILSFSFFFAATISQWSPLLVAAALIPALGFLLVVKPTIGAALFLYRPRWRVVGAGLVFLLASLALRPGWPVEWLHAIRAATHETAPIARWGGPLVLLALLRWRRSEARLVVAMACIPHTTLLYDALPLFLVPGTWMESLILAALTWVARTISAGRGPYPTLAAHTAASASMAVWLLYLPCVIMVLRRPNEGSDLAAFLRDGGSAWRRIIGCGRRRAVAAGQTSSGTRER